MNNKETKKEKASHIGSKNSSANAVLRYLYIPLIFVLIAVIISAPAVVYSYNFAKDTVHKAQSVLSPTEYDIELNQSLYNDKDASPFETGNGYASLSCEKLGINSIVYRGTNRVALRSGVANSSKSSVIGTDKAVAVYGYSSSSFANLMNAEKGNVFKAVTNYGELNYKVTDVFTVNTEQSINLEEYDGAPQKLIMYTNNSTDYFSIYNQEYIVVVAECTTDDVLFSEEVSNG